MRNPKRNHHSNERNKFYKDKALRRHNRNRLAVSLPWHQTEELRKPLDQESSHGIDDYITN
jgi:hypothetical protein